MKKVFFSSNIADKCLRNSSQPIPVKTLDLFFDQYNNPDNKVLFTKTITNCFKKKLSVNEIAHFYILARHVIFKDESSTLLEQISIQQLRFERPLSKVKHTNPLTPLLRHFSNHLNDVVSLYSTFEMILCTKPNYSEENDPNIIKRTIGVLDKFAEMFETISWITWGDESLYRQPLQVVLMDLLLRDFSIMFYHYTVQLTVVLNNIYNYLEAAFSKTLGIFSRYDDFVQQLYSILKRQKLVSTDLIPELVFMPANPIVNFTKAWKRHHDDSKKRNSVDREIDNFVIDFMKDNQRNLESLQKFISRDSVSHVQTCASAVASPIDSLIRTTDDIPQFHEISLSPFRSQSEVLSPQIGSNTPRKPNQKVRNSEIPVDVNFL